MKNQQHGAGPHQSPAAAQVDGGKHEQAGHGQQAGAPRPWRGKIPKPYGRGRQHEEQGGIAAHALARRKSDMIEEKLLAALGIEEQHHDAQHSRGGKQEEHRALRCVRRRNACTASPEGGDQSQCGPPARIGGSVSGQSRHVAPQANATKRESAHQVGARIGFIHRRRQGRLAPLQHRYCGSVEAVIEEEPGLHESGQAQPVVLPAHSPAINAKRKQQRGKEQVSVCPGRRSIGEVHGNGYQRQRHDERGSHRGASPQPVNSQPRRQRGFDARLRDQQRPGHADRAVSRRQPYGHGAEQQRDQSVGCRAPCGRPAP